MSQFNAKALSLPVAGVIVLSVAVAALYQRQTGALLFARSGFTDLVFATAIALVPVGLAGLGITILVRTQFPVFDRNTSAVQVADHLNKNEPMLRSIQSGGGEERLVVWDRFGCVAATPALRVRATKTATRDQQNQLPCLVDNCKLAAVLAGVEDDAYRLSFASRVAPSVKPDPEPDTPASGAFEEIFFRATTQAGFTGSAPIEPLSAQ